MKKLLAIALCFILLLSFLIACTSQTSGTTHQSVNNGSTYTSVDSNGEINIPEVNLNNREQIIPPFADCNCCIETHASQDIISFEEALLFFTTDIVLAQFVAQRPMGRYNSQLKFTVSERILGDAADTIFVYISHHFGAEIGYGAFFKYGVNYLLPLARINWVLSNFHEDGYHMVPGHIAINLDDPTQSIMYGESIMLHTTEFDFDRRDISTETISSFMKEIASESSLQDRLPFIIRSNDIQDVVNGSPVIIVVEISEHIRSLYNCIGGNDWTIVTVVNSMKGQVNVGYTFNLFFPVDSVIVGERYIVALHPSDFPSSHPITGPGLYNSYRLTSRNSVFSMEYQQRIGEILGTW